MAERRPPVVTDDTPIGPDVDLDHDDVRRRDGTRLTSAAAAGIVREVQRASRSARRREQDLVPLRVIVARLVRIIADLRLVTRAERGLRHAAHAAQSRGHVR